MLLLQFKKLYIDAKPPMRTQLDSEFNLFAHLQSESGRPIKRLVSVRATVAIPTGIVARPPPNHYGMILTCKAHAMKSIWTMSHTVSDDRDGELRVLLYNGGFEPFYVQHEDMIAHLLILPLGKITTREVKEWE